MADVPVIDWDEAMEQCGDDEEFCRELLSDLRGEVDQQVIRIDEMLTQVRILDFTLWTLFMISRDIRCPCGLIHTSTLHEKGRKAATSKKG